MVVHVVVARREPGREVLVLTDSPDDRVQDPLALAEIELYGEVVIAASASDGPLSLDEIDRILGVRPVRQSA